MTVGGAWAVGSVAVSPGQTDRGRSGWGALGQGAPGPGEEEMLHRSHPLWLSPEAALCTGPTRSRSGSLGGHKAHIFPKRKLRTGPRTQCWAARMQERKLDHVHPTRTSSTSRCPRSGDRAPSPHVTMPCRPWWPLMYTNMRGHASTRSPSSLAEGLLPHRLWPHHQLPVSLASSSPSLHFIPRAPGNNQAGSDPQLTFTECSQRAGSGSL